MAENVFIDTLSRSFVITADLVIPKGGANGVVLSQGGLFGGWSLYVKDGVAKFVYNWLAREKYYIEPLPGKKVTLVYDFTYDGGGLHRAAKASTSSTAGKWVKGESTKPKGRVVPGGRDSRCRHGRVLPRHRRLRSLGQQSSRERLKRSR
jgi:hypothetical protein